jgi:diketogulonate reductase-like aldo/keto reductase
MRQVLIAPDLSVPVIGQGTWRMGEQAARRAEEIRALRAGVLEYGLNLIDTAEMYGDGSAEEIVGEAIAGIGTPVVVVSKVYPHNATRRGTIAACERSLKRLGLDRIDIYLLHWRGGTPLGETIDAFETLRAHGKIRHYGVSNFDTPDLDDWLSAGGQGVTNQVLYNLTRRGIEWDLSEACRMAGFSIMAYSPVEQGRLLRPGSPGATALGEIARCHDVAPAAVALAWSVRNPSFVAIPKSSNPEHLAANRAALELQLEPDELALLDRSFPPPLGARPLEML